MAQFVWIPVLIMGLIIGFLELIFVHKDEAGMSWLKHGIHALPVMFVFLFISMNIDFVLGLVNMKPALWLTIAIRVVVGIIAMAKIQAAAAVAGKVGEKLPHTLIIGVLIMVAPFIWDSVLCNIDFFKTIKGACSVVATK